MSSIQNQQSTSILVNHKLTTCQTILLSIQLSLLLAGRIFDDISWYDFGVSFVVWQSLSLGLLILSAVGKIYLKSYYEGIGNILMIKSQTKFILPWALTGVLMYLIWRVFGCNDQIYPISHFYTNLSGCMILMFQTLVTTFNFSLLANTKSHLIEVIFYQVILFGQIIYSGTLLAHYLKTLDGSVRQRVTLYIGIVIANQMMMMDIIFKAGYQDKQAQKYQRVRENYLNQLEERKRAHNIVSLDQIQYQTDEEIKGEIYGEENGK